MSVRLLLLVAYCTFFIHSVHGQIRYQTQYAVELPLAAGPDAYTLTTSQSVFQQQFRLNSKDTKLDHFLVEYLFHSYTGWLRPDGDITLTFYEGTIGQPGQKIYSQGLNLSFLDVESGIETPENTLSVITISDSLVLEYGKDYIWEITKPENSDWGYNYSLYKCPGNNWPTNFGDQGVWFKFLGQAFSNTDPSFSIVSTNDPLYLVDTFSNQFTYLIANKYQKQDYTCKTIRAGKLNYHVADPSKLLIDKKSVIPGVKEEISLVALDTGIFTIYVVDQGDSIAYFDVHATDKKEVDCSYTYLKFPGESSHNLLNEFNKISKNISDIFSSVNVFINFTDLGIKEYDWDLNGDNSYYDPEYKEIYAAMDQVPNTNYFSHMIMMRSSKNDAQSGGNNGGGTSRGFGKWDAPPRYGLVAFFLNRTPESLGATLAHELGHNFGLTHYSNANRNFIAVANDQENIMHVGNRKDNLFGLQARTIHSTIDYRRKIGEVYESREQALIFQANDTILAYSNSFQALPVTTNSDASILLKVLEGKEVIEIFDNKLRTIGEGEAIIGVFVHATNNYIAAADTIIIGVQKMPPVADFDFFLSDDPYRVSFRDQTSNKPTSWVWHFGDGKTSTQQNPTHDYLIAGEYMVRLIASNPFGIAVKETLVKVIDKIAPEASFNYSLIDSSGQVNFYDLSINSPTAWTWDFGDGNISKQQNPSHKYQFSGVYEVRLVASNQYGADSTNQTVNIKIGQAPLAAFGYTILAETGKIIFDDQSINAPDSWNWNFGNGNTSREQDPYHYYLNSGEYTVALIATNRFGSDTTSQSIVIEVGKAPIAAFNYLLTEQSGQLRILDQSSNEPTTWFWDFGDGNSSTEQSPTHMYINSGTYTVRLMATNQFGSDTTSQNIRISIGQAPVAAFRYSLNEPTGQVSFTDISLNEPTIWLWSFGDGNSSNQQNPTHSYLNSGGYPIKLTVANAFGSDDTTILFTFTNVQPPEAFFDYSILEKSGQVNFMDQSKNYPDAWTWDFGDGNSSNEQNPSHKFMKSGAYTVALVASNQYGSDTINLTMVITIGQAPVANFNYSMLEPSGQVSFSDQSINDPTIWQWEFGDGNASTERSPVHKYESSGNYTVRLIVANPFGIGSGERIINVVVTSINSLPGGSKLLISPNPFEDMLKFNLTNWKSNTAQLRFYTISGQLHHEIPIIEAAAIDTRNWPSGTYIYQFIYKSQILSSGQLIRK